MKESFDTILNLLKDYYQGNEVMAIVGIVCLLYLIIFDKEARKKYAIPIVLVIALVINPILYQYIYSKTYMYWRLFWIFSEHLIIATAFISIINRFKNDIIKIICFIGVCILIVSNGTNVFETDKFEKTISLEKLPAGVIEICDAMLELEEEPYVIPDVHFSCNDRQYSGKIKQLYGRNAFWYISDLKGEAREIRNYSYVDGDFWQVCYYASKNGYQFIVTENRYIMPDIIKDTGFELIKEIETDNNALYLYYYVGRDKTLAEETD